MENLLNTDTIKDWLFKDEKFHRSHGARGKNLGTGLLYYTMAYCFNAKLCVCLGSGSGFVPRCMKQAQHDLENDGKTILIDANLPEAGWGDPDYFDGKSSFFRDNFDVEIIEKTTVEAAKDGFKDIDYLHIDADHSYEGAMADLLTYSQFMAKKHVITMHDTIPRKAGVWKVIKEAKEGDLFDVVDLPLNMGVAMLTRRSNG